MTTLTLEDIHRIAATFEEIRKVRKLAYILAGKEAYRCLLEKIKPMELRSGFETFGFSHDNVEYVKFGLGGDWDLLLLDQNKEPIETIRLSVDKPRSIINDGPVA